MATKTCPFCAEEIQEAAVVCKHCGRDFPASKPTLEDVMARGQAKAAEHAARPWWRRWIVLEVAVAALIIASVVILLQPRKTFTVVPGGCDSSADGSTGMGVGEVHNLTGTEHTYLVTVNFADHALAVIGSGTDFVTVPAHGSGAYQVTAPLGGPMRGCAASAAAAPD